MPSRSLASRSCTTDVIILFTEYASDTIKNRASNCPKGGRRRRRRRRMRAGRRTRERSWQNRLVDGRKTARVA
jgi:hypothetical protein